MKRRTSEERWQVVGKLIYVAACKVDTTREMIRHWRFGRRSAFLAMFGVIYIMLGFSYTGSRPTPDLRQTLRVATHLLPLWVYGILWMVAGVLAVGSAVLYPRGKVGFAALTFIAAIWSFWYLVAWIAHDTTRGPVSFIIYGAFAAATIVVSGLVDPDDIDPNTPPPAVPAPCTPDAP